jgi:hypothetical protein
MGERLDTLDGLNVRIPSARCSPDSERTQKIVQALEGSKVRVLKTLITDDK